ncbi:MAG: peroxidase family protein [Hyphomicrobiaceae bacterium]|nr:peroxidase family protein [Hyphomicrobiaceae bacterium]
MRGLVSSAFRLFNRRIAWYRMPFLLSVVNLLALQRDLRRNNLYGTPDSELTAPSAGETDIRGFRTADGSYNDLAAPAMGMVGARFGRNVPLKHAYGEQPDTLLKPNPRIISNELLARKAFKPVPHLNLMTAAWLQFMTHDWFSHGDNDPARRIEVPVPDGDGWDGGPTNAPGHVSVHATLADPLRGPDDEGLPETYRNHVTHWWDGSQIYGSSEARIRQMRTDTAGRLLPDGQLYLDRHGLLGLDPEKGVELAGFNESWWLGLSLMTNLFVREHNAIAAHLRLDYPAADDEWIFGKARLINAALMAKIHAVEWTPAILNTDTLRAGMRGNWWGLLGEAYEKAHGRHGLGERITGIPGSGHDHHGKPFAITEEFVAVYRMHSLLPDELAFRRLADNAVIDRRTLTACVGARTRDVFQHATLSDAIYSFATMNVGALRLDNYPNSLRRLTLQGPDAHVLDLAVTDIVRDRERGVPRYCEMRRQLRMSAPSTFEELTGGDMATAKRLAAIYAHVEEVDLLIGCLSEPLPPGFGFGDTAFRIFVLMATRRLKSDRFFTDDYNEAVYTPQGMRWIQDNGMASVLVRHFPELGHKVGRVRNAFFPWPLD